MREEAKITAWENLQKAKAEAAIRKLEVVFNSTYDIVVCVCVYRYVCTYVFKYRLQFIEYTVFFILTKGFFFYFMQFFSIFMRSIVLVTLNVETFLFKFIASFLYKL